MAVSKCSVLRAGVPALLLLSPVHAQAEPVFHPPMRLAVDGAPIDHGARWAHAGPCWHDVDGDGKNDLLVGDFGGQFWLYRNVGSPGQPKLSPAVALQAGGVDAQVRIY